jgi:hypothetical protein
LSELLRLHPRVLSISELFSMLGGPRVFEQASLTGAEHWNLLSRIAPDFIELLRIARVPEVLQVSEHASDYSPLELVTLPHLSLGGGALRELAALFDSAQVASPAAHFERLFSWLSQRCKRELWVERSGGSIEYGEQICRAWPDAKLILLTRDGRDTAYSMAHHPMFRVRVARILARDFALPVRACLDAEIPYHRFGAYWSALMIKAQRLLRNKSPEDVFMLRYEQLVAAPRATVAALARFLTGEEAPASWLDQAQQRVRVVPSHWMSLPESERAALEASCLPGLRCLR